MSGQCDLEDRQLAMGLETTKAFGSLQHGGSRPAQGHCGIAPALHVAADAPGDVRPDAGVRAQISADTAIVDQSAMRQPSSRRVTVAERPG